MLACRLQLTMNFVWWFPSRGCFHHSTLDVHSTSFLNFCLHFRLAFMFLLLVLGFWREEKQLKEYAFIDLQPVQFYRLAQARWGYLEQDTPFRMRFKNRTESSTVHPAIVVLWDKSVRAVCRFEFEMAWFKTNRMDWSDTSHTVTGWVSNEYYS